MPRYYEEDEVCCYQPSTGDDGDYTEHNEMNSGELSYESLRTTDHERQYDLE